MSLFKQNRDAKGQPTPPVTQQSEAISDSENVTAPKHRKKKETSKWTVLDTAIVLLLVLCVAGAVVRGFVDRPKTSEKPQSGSYIVRFEIDEIHVDVISEIEKLDALYLYETNDLIGYIGRNSSDKIALEIEASHAEEDAYMVSAQGSMVCFDGVMTDGSLLLPSMNSYIGPGSTLTLRTDRAVFTVTVIAIEEASTGEK